MDLALSEMLVKAIVRISLSKQPPMESQVATFVSIDSNSIIPLRLTSSRHDGRHSSVGGACGHLKAVLDAPDPTSKENPY